MTSTTDLSRLSRRELLELAAECSRIQRQAEAVLLRLQLRLALVNYQRRQRGDRVLHGWARLADTAVPARLWCGAAPRRRGPM